MRSIFIFILLFFPFLLQGQTRFLDSLFSVEIQSNILYGNNTNYDGSSQDLYLDVYFPSGDTVEQRPLIVFAHGGSFLAGSKENPSMVALCTRFAQMGYVTASINYRLGVDYFEVLGGNGEEEFTYATLRGTHDLRAAIRFFRKDASTENLYGIDTSLIIAGGSSAGGFMGLHAAYLDRLEEIPEEISDIEELGGIEGNSGNEGYSSEIHAAVNLCGAIGDTAWIETSDTALFSVHGSEDQTVPFGTGNVELFGIPVAEVHGSSVIEQKTTQTFTSHQFMPFWGADHVPYDPLAGEPEHEAYMDSTVYFLKTSMYEHFFGTVTAGPVVQAKENDFVVYPNPSRQGFVIAALQADEAVAVLVYDLYGKLIRKLNPENERIKISLERGAYIIEVQWKDHTKTVKKVMIR
jgi:hypothetical protein